MEVVHEVSSKKSRGAISKREWFSEWFNSPYYHILYKSRDNAEAHQFIDNLQKYFQFTCEDQILDLACGRGRHAIYLNSKGFDVVGIDIAPENISYAKQFENERLHFYVHDMRRPYVRSRFCYVLNLFTSFGYFETEGENINAVCTVTEALKPGGKLILDFFNTDRILKNLKPHYRQVIDGIQFDIQKKLESGFIVKDIEFEDEGNSFHFQERVKAISCEQFLHYFDVADLELISIFGDYALNPYDKETSDRMIFVAQRPQRESFGLRL
ncbi:class I SAM-dependent methyltransferase [Cytophagaceae bacterium DM2B3-1]|uniref:Class I SAM-dependent methyltransferase n=3 Tax=Xanthocytophaga TaxID=3078918 RepID=A0AAE3QQ64_9BACT|nr:MULTISPECIES: class I SAM-dependent methyltransferase [Xanthocytophaga]MDJ1471230.1 class I SAM-dependent methyltransferase [Xanthocytophaga flavus]MDJ1483447.1 class I SAM-dependent methyltransferase [Xanthocytophaga flavus]MDJ1495771.1 class I SAM-dependent methyltransferase [Xanthocytophaga flavus]MDJ1505567.1 class I SAM-dependent methyltransferase [Xanthocytophaga agilis]